MKVYLRDHNEGLVEAWKTHFVNEPNVTVQHGDIFQTMPQAFVSPANSFGIMDGGIDRYYSETFGWDLSKRLQERIKLCHPLGELLVGDCVVIAATLDNADCWMISAPTMRLPRRISAENVFLATRVAVFEALSQGFKELAIPGMGTGVGAVPYDEAAKAMAYGYGAAVKVFNERKINNA